MSFSLAPGRGKSHDVFKSVACVGNENFRVSIIPISPPAHHRCGCLHFSLHRHCSRRLSLLNATVHNNSWRLDFMSIPYCMNPVSVHRTQCCYTHFLGAKRCMAQSCATPFQGRAVRCNVPWPTAATHIFQKNYANVLNACEHLERAEWQQHSTSCWGPFHQVLQVRSVRSMLHLSGQPIGAVRSDRSLVHKCQPFRTGTAKAVSKQALCTSAC
ncbi:hypothetical protein EDD37DRAFT_260576 [Exophiala viscosa]|uniref:uncharacterized protein n=1 Tax=Exophiala viscosa TaxID=2486360 RepID=UPI00218CAB8D|nr:hypothetical protein EDD37DRAFT_260576 [Exophiala viscosa]